MSRDQRSDALVFFGATGDLAYKQIFPGAAGDDPARPARLPIIGVARSGWTLDQLRAAGPRQRRRRTAAVDEAGVRAAVGPAALRRRRLPAIPRRTSACARRWAAAARPLHYLAIPPSMFARRRRRSRDVRLRRARARRRREAVRPRPRVGARAQRARCASLPRVARSSASTTTSARSRCRTCCTSASPTRSSSRSGTATTSSSVQITMAEDFGVRGPRRVLRGGRRDPRRGAEPPAAGGGAAGDGAAGRRTTREALRDEKAAGLQGDAAARPGGRRARAVPRLPRRAGRRARLQRRDLRRAAPAHRHLALGRRAVLHPRRQVPADHGHRGVGGAQASAAGDLRGRRPPAAAELLPLSPQPGRRASRSARASRARARRWRARPSSWSPATSTPERDGPVRAAAGRRDARRRSRCSRARTRSRRRGAWSIRCSTAAARADLLRARHLGPGRGRTRCWTEPAGTTRTPD